MAAPGPLRIVSSWKNVSRDHESPEDCLTFYEVC
jgi:hypothetical protein